MKKLLIALLTGLGWSKEDITALVEQDDAKLEAVKTEDLVKKIRDSEKTGLLNDNDFLSSIPEDKINPTILKKIESGQYARFQNELIEVATKKLGLDEKTAWSEEDKKSIKKLVEKMAVGYLAKNNNTEGLQKMQLELSTLQETLDKRDGEHATKLTEAVGNEGKKYGERIIKLIAKNNLSTLDKIKLTVNPDYIVDPVLKKVGAKYNAVLVLGEDDNLVLKQKDNNALDVLDDKKKVVSFQQALRNVVLEDKLGTEEAADDPNDPTKKKTVSVNSKEGEQTADVIPSYIAKAAEENAAPEPAK